MFARVIFGNKFDFTQENGFTQMFVDNTFESERPSSGSIDRDIGLLLMGYAE